MTDTPSASPNQNRLYIGSVYHKRFQPFVHELRYRVFSIFINLDDLPKLKKRYGLLSYNAFNLMSFHDKDHGARNGTPIKQWVLQKAAQKGLSLEKGTIYALFFPRLLGYCFTPLTIYYCYDEAHILSAIIYEVKNTFGDQHAYFCPVENSDIEAIEQKKEKLFHVSPFMDLQADYYFKLRAPGERLYFTIDQRKAGEPLLFANWLGQDIGLSKKNILKAFFKMPFLNLKIILGIHWHALKLWIKGAKFHKRPEPPKHDLS